MTCTACTEARPVAQTTQARRISATDVAELEAALTAVVDATIPEALATRQGIRITRLAPGEFAVQADPEVPCGYTICAT